MLFYSDKGPCWNECHCFRYCTTDTVFCVFGRWPPLRHQGQCGAALMFRIIAVGENPTYASLAQQKTTTGEDNSKADGLTVLLSKTYRKRTVCRGQNNSKAKSI